MTPEHKHDVAVQLVTATPSAVAIAIDWLNVSAERWLTRVGIGFIVLQAAYLVWRWRRDFKRERRGQEPRDG